MAYRKKVWIVKKIFLIIISLILCACHTTPQLEGTWTCEKSPLENKDIYTAYLTLEIDKDLSFNMYDAKAGNPVIRGKMIHLLSNVIILMILIHLLHGNP